MLIIRKWYKYSLDHIRKGKIYLPIDSSFKEHSHAMGGYERGESYYENKEDFFNKYYYGYHFNRLECYDEFIRRKISRENSILSIASGRGANELRLLEEGYNVVCSDIQKPKCYEDTLKLFPGFNFIELDILKNPSEVKHDVLLCFSLMYLFDNNMLTAFFKNVYESLMPKGRFIFDCGGPQDNILSFVFHDMYLKNEVIAYRIARLILKQKWDGFIVKHHGYRHTDEEITSSARGNGFKLLDKKDCSFITEFRRSVLFNKLITQGSLLEKMFSPFGKCMPYIRLFLFEKMD